MTASGGPGTALGLLALRLALVAVATAACAGLLGVWTGAIAFPPGPTLAALALLPVNLVCLAVVARRYRREGTPVRRVFSPSRRPVALEVLWGLLWLAVLYVPFAGAVMGTMWLLHGDGMFTAFATVFYDPASAPAISPVVGLVLGIVVVLTFAPLNAPAEELVFRGYAPSRLARRIPLALAIAVSAVAFGLQHALFAPTLDAMLVYVVAFTVWGAGSGIIVARQRRLLPITIAHGVVNLGTSAPAVVFPALELAGAL
jgi:uncharacterized protein